MSVSFEKYCSLGLFDQTITLEGTGTKMSFVQKLHMHEVTRNDNFYYLYSRWLKINLILRVTGNLRVGVVVAL